MRQPASARSRPQRLSPFAWLSLNLALVACFGLWPLRGGDLLQHLNIGRWIWEHQAIPRTDVWTYIDVGKPFVAHSWGAEVLFYGVEEAAGTLGFLLLRFGLVAAALAFALKTARLLGASWSAVMMVAPAILMLVWGRLEFRPQLFSSVFHAAQLWILMAVHTERLDRRWLWLLPGLYAIWINVHGAWTLGLLTLAVVMGAMALMRVRDRSIKPHICHLIVVFVACVAGVFVNPYTSDLVLFPLTMQADWIRAMSPEWQSAVVSRGWALVGAGEVLPWRVLQVTYFGYSLAITLAVLQALRRWRTADLLPPALMGLWLAFTVHHLRTVADMALLTGPFLAAALTGNVGNMCPKSGRRWPMTVGTAITVGLAAVALWGTATHRHRDALFDWGHGEPRCLMHALERLNLVGTAAAPAKIHASWVNDWLVRRFGARVQTSFMWEFMRGEAGTWDWLYSGPGHPERMIEHLDRYGVDTSVLYHPQFEFRMAEPLRQRGWTVIFIDNGYIVLVRHPRPDHFTYRLLTRSWPPIEITPANARRVLEEADHALQACPQAAREAAFAWAAKVNALNRLGRHAEAEAALAAVPPDLIEEGPAR